MLASQTIPTSNQIISWLKEMETLRQEGRRARRNVVTAALGIEVAIRAALDIVPTHILDFGCHPRLFRCRYSKLSSSCAPLALRNIAKKWTMPVTNWKAVLNRFAIVYENDCWLTDENGVMETAENKNDFHRSLSPYCCCSKHK